MLIFFVTRERIELGAITQHNIKQLKRLNSVVFPVSYNDKFYKDVLDVGELAKLCECKCCDLSHKSLVITGCGSLFQHVEQSK